MVTDRCHMQSSGREATTTFWNQQHMGALLSMIEGQDLARCRDRRGQSFWNHQRRRGGHWIGTNDPSLCGLAMPRRSLRIFHGESGTAAPRQSIIIKDSDPNFLLGERQCEDDGEHGFRDV